MLKEQWAAKLFDEKPLANAGALGQVEILGRLIGMSYDEYIQAWEGEDDEQSMESNGPAPSGTRGAV